MVKWWNGEMVKWWNGERFKVYRIHRVDAAHWMQQASTADTESA